MNYTELKVHATKAGVEAVYQLFLKYGIDQVAIDDPSDLVEIMNKEHEYSWDYVDDNLKDNGDREPTISAFFEDNEENQKLISELKVEIMMLKAAEQYNDFGRGIKFGRLYAETVPVKDGWQDAWKENFKPTQVTEKIVVKPTWEEYEPKTGQLVIQIDPGMAFGTGTHETTSLCMKMLEKYLKPEMKVMDVGCGSGILAISAALQGCKDILGIEIEPDAVRVAVENVELNEVDDVVTIKEGDLTKGLNYKADIVVANLMHNLIMELAPSARKHLVRGGIFISSGILIEKKDQVAKAIKEAKFEILEIPEDGEWCAIVARSRNKILGLF
ncbi:MAG: 50S ribosomal protein L11 methyltransferase [Eubacteriales bacterium]|nr:50S ribosomal protein L11 methyltransferase [Eubacteriales bacterium]